MPEFTHSGEDMKYMHSYKTLKRLINVLRKIESQPLSGLKGYEKLSRANQVTLGELVAGIGNILNDDEFNIK